MCQILWTKNFIIQFIQKASELICVLRLDANSIFLHIGQLVI